MAPLAAVAQDERARNFEYAVNALLRALAEERQH